MGPDPGPEESVKLWRLDPRRLLGYPMNVLARSIVPSRVPASTDNFGSSSSALCASVPLSPSVALSWSRLVLGTGLCALLIGCGPGGPSEAEWPPRAKKWFERASASFHHVDIDEAQIAIENALRLDRRPKVRLLAARIALAQLEYDRTIELLEGIQSSEARAARGRAFWYSGRLEQAADELEALIADPDVRDVWAENIAKLARRGSGRQPFRLTGAMLAVTDMPQIGSSALVVPLELNGEPALGLVSTGTAEVVIDSSKQRDPQWVSLRFGQKLEVKDVPAITKDLSGISRELRAPIKLLLGVNLLRHINPTVDLMGGQFVVRNFEPPPPPVVTTAELRYVRGGGMVVNSSLGAGGSASDAALLIDTGMQFPLALDEGGWKKAGVSLDSLQDIPGAKGLRQGDIPSLGLGAYELPRVPAVHGIAVDEVEANLNVDIDGVIGSGVLAAFRVTWFRGGKAMWLEEQAVYAGPAPAPRRGPAASPSGASPSGPAPPGAGDPVAPKKPAG